MAKQQEFDFREVLYTVDREGRRKWVYPSVVRGSFWKLRAPVVYILMLLYILAPWLDVDGRQAVLIDIANRKFLCFGATFWATDTFYLALALGFLGICLFFFTTVLGRVWCGWACPETVFLEFLYRPIEALVEGNHSKRKALDCGPLSFEKIWKKLLKYTLFFLVSWVLSATTLAYFIGHQKAAAVMWNPGSEDMLYFYVMVLIAGTLLFQFGWFREQLCTALCPYARFQSVLLDEDSIVVAYDEKRGEPRMPLRKGLEESAERGDCIDCGLCSRVCPTGIDIRNGLQLECIHCAACIDACDMVMEKIGKPRGLVRYDTERGLLEGRRVFMRPRVFLYGAILIVYAVVFTISLMHRPLSEFKILRAPGQVPFQVLADGTVSNYLQLHISNKSEKKKFYTASVEGSDMKLITPLSPFPVEEGGLATMPVFISFPLSLLKNGKVETAIVMKDGEGFESEKSVTLLGPQK